MITIVAGHRFSKGKTLRHDLVLKEITAGGCVSQYVGGAPIRRFKHLSVLKFLSTFSRNRGS